VLVVFAQEVAIPIDHVGHYKWTSSPTTIDHYPGHFKTEVRVNGEADVHEDGARASVTGNSWVMNVEFDVNSFSPGAWYEIIYSDAHDGGDVG
jgi:hypothetical protein